ncbi:MAG: hypothetical protein HY973_00425 [Candidatus Kerfeldbacteria bacterium]|nr:hypothetical protein [Candidatus Kerfeldbacteria bacterium]
MKEQISYLAQALFLQKRRLYTIPLLAIGTVILFSFLPLPVGANLGSFLAEWIILPLARFIGGLVITLIGILIQIAQYNDFINAPAVAKGWVIVRDVVNMFVIVMMLVIAFATTFRIEEYQYKKLLSKLLIMSVLVNFSKMLTGLFIDFSQVIMLTFVNGFKDAAAGNFVNGFHIEDMFTFAKDKKIGGIKATDSGDDSAYFVASIMALISMSITLVVIAIYLIVFLLRIAILWLLIIISPMAYVLSAFPGQAKKYSTEWWETFGKYLTSGPILAFFLWLSLAIMQFDSDAFGKAFYQTEAQNASSMSLADVPGAVVTNIGKSDVLLSFIINIVMLLGGLWMAQRLGVAGGKLAGSALSKIQQAGAAIAKGIVKAPLGAAGYGFRKLAAATGITAFHWPSLKEAYQEWSHERKQRDIQMMKGKGGSLLKSKAGVLLSAGSRDWWQAYGAGGFLNHRGFGYARRMLTGGEKEWNKINAEIQDEKDKLQVSMLASKQDGPEEAYLKKREETITEADKRNSFYGGISKDAKAKEAELEALKKQPKLSDADKAKKKQLEKDKAELDKNDAEFEHINTQIEQQQAIVDNPSNELEATIARAKIEALNYKKGEFNKVDKNGNLLKPSTKQAQEQINEWVGEDGKGGKKQTAKDEANKDPETLRRLAWDEYKKETEQKEKDATALANNKYGSDEIQSKNELLAGILRELSEKIDEKEKMEKEGVEGPLLSRINDSILNLTDRIKKQKIDISEIQKGNLAAPKDAAGVNDEKSKAILAQAKAMRKVMEFLEKAGKDNPEKTEKELWTEAERSKYRDSAEIGMEQIRGKEKHREEYMLPPTFYAEQARRTLVNEELKKINTDNYHELIAYFRQAQHEKDPVRMDAILRKLANDYNDNELFNAYGYSSDFKGLKDFFQKEVVEHGGMGQQQALGLANDMSYINESRHHWETARIIGHRGGKFEWFTDQYHVKECLAEIRKSNPRELARNFNRLAYGGEYNTPDGDRKFKISPLGVALVSNLGRDIAQFIERGETNPNIVVNLNQPDVREILKRIPGLYDVEYMGRKFWQIMDDAIGRLPAAGDLDASVHKSFHYRYED